MSKARQIPPGFNLALLPDSIEERVRLALTANFNPQQKRLLRYTLEHSGAYTDELARQCSVGYPPNRMDELRKLLPLFGLDIECRALKLKRTNDCGHVGHVHTWHLIQIEIPGGRNGR